MWNEIPKMGRVTHIYTKQRGHDCIFNFGISIELSIQCYVNALVSLYYEAAQLHSGKLKANGN